MDVKLVGAKCQHCQRDISPIYGIIGLNTWGHWVAYGETITEEEARLSGHMFHKGCPPGWLLELEPVED